MNFDLEKRTKLAIMITSLELLSTFRLILTAVLVSFAFNGFKVCIHAQGLPEAPSGVEGTISFTDKTTAEVLKYMNYEAEIHNVESNGYIIELTRMINPLVKSKEDLQRSIIFSHGLGQDSIAHYLAFAGFHKAKAPTSKSYSSDIYDDIDANDYDYEKMCLPCLFSDNNYDVFIENHRGSSRGSLLVTNHTLDEADHYWNFTIDNQALEDLPNVIDFVLKLTNKQNVSYVGYSKGTLHMHMLLSEKPDYADKIAAYVGLAPISYLGSILSEPPIRIMVKLLEKMFEKLNLPFANYDMCVAINTLSVAVCEESMIRTTLCRKICNLIGGEDEKINVLTGAFFGHTVEPNSLKVIAQFGQLVTSNKFQKFDYGSPELNTVAYNQPEPPLYNVADIKLKKMILVRSTGNDKLSQAPDQQRFIDELKVPLFKDIVTPPAYNHFSYQQAKDCFAKVFRPVIQNVNRAYLTPD